MNHRRQSQPPAHRERLAERIAALDWPQIGAELDVRGAALTGPLLSAGECAALTALYPRQELFRSRIVMKRHGFGQGEYQYFAYPLPPSIATLRQSLYERLAATANRWRTALGERQRFPAGHEVFLRRCHRHGQTKPTPLLLRYGAGDYNCLHQDVYGEQFFPLQVTLLLSVPGRHFTGGEFVLTEQRPRMQSRAEVISLERGEAVIFAVRERPVRGARGVYRVRQRHGVSRVHAGERFACGIIFHDAA